MTSDIVLLEGVRTGFGAFGGSLKDFSATDLGVIAAKGALARAKVDPAWIDETIFGNVVQTSADAIYLARHIRREGSVTAGNASGIVDGAAAVVASMCIGGGQGIAAVVEAL